MDSSTESKELFRLIKAHKFEEFVQYLNKHQEIDVNLRDENNQYLITYAIMLNSTIATKALIARECKLDITDTDGRGLLYTPINLGYTKLLQLLLHYNESIVGISLVDIKDRHGHIPLHYAIRTKNPNIVNILLNAKSNVNTVDNSNLNALHMAVRTKITKIVEMILQHNININARTNTGETALHLACNFQLIDIVKLLLAKNIDVNVQDYDHEFTALTYCVNLNNTELTRILLKAGSDVNAQDFSGNTSLHYAISESNYEIANMLINSKYSSTSINLNLYNIDSKLPITMLLDKTDIYMPLLPALIQESNLNFQDTNGRTPLHRISFNDLWKDLYDSLKTKKMNIFIKDKDGVRPIDLVSKQDRDKYLDMITFSYLYQLRNQHFEWNEDWEELCRQDLEYDKLDKKEKKNVDKFLKKNQRNEVCQNIVKNKLIKIMEDNTASCRQSSYPSKRGKKCIRITVGQELEYCTFTGTILDILVGLLYLLEKYPKACGVLTTSVASSGMCQYYKAVGVSSTERCNFFNFEIIWVYKKLYIAEEFIKGFNKCMNTKGKTFTIIPLGIELRQGSHANYLIYDHKRKEIERFEPYGSRAPNVFDYSPKSLDKILEHRFAEIDSSIKYISPDKYMPKIGFQLLDIMEQQSKKIGDPGGFCAMWAIWYTDMRMAYYDIDRKKLVGSMIKSIRTQNLSFKRIIRNYSREIIERRDNIFQKVGMTINDWINDQYTEDQYNKLIRELTIIIKQF